MTKAKQTVKNKSAQNATAHASLTVSNTIGAAGWPPSQGDAEPAAAGVEEAAPDQSNPEAAETSADWAELPPIYLVLAISINLAADYQNKNANVVEDG